MEAVIISAIVLGLLVVAALFKAVQLIPGSSSAVLERFGRYHRTLDPGLHIVFPFVDFIRNRIDRREQVVPFPPQPVTTQDSVVVNIDTVLYYRVTDVRAATYEVASYIQAMEQLLVATLRTVISGMSLAKAVASRDEIAVALRRVLEEDTGKWGVQVHRLELKSIELPIPIQKSMEGQMRADLDKKAAILRAEAIRAEAVMKAETERDVAAILAGKAEAGRTARPLPGPSAPSGGHQPLRKGDPRRIGRYDLVARLGQGGMGTVFLGRSPGERMVAVKVIHAEFVSDPTFRQRFTREIEAARRVGGFHTAAVVDADAEGENPWLVTEYIPGPSLHDVLKQHGAMPPRTLNSLALGIAEALEGIHSCGIVHRDLKPSNIIVSTAGPRVIDFGIARALGSTSLTRTDFVVGTQGFLAPEQLAGQAPTPATDLYAYGMVLCHAAGAVPFPDGEDLESALELLPSTLVDVITRCLAHRPADRPNCTQVLERLTRIRQKSDDWLPPPIRTMVDFHNAPTAR
ncbi:SPFH domain-containing protein [Streptomyces sp. NPDC087428]|uniref:protein kinase domain-containing protein n=1 Tax=Streptomyces sp. NPDC087428 TaxID=3365788 RepID=UPI00382E4786